MLIGLHGLAESGKDESYKQLRMIGEIDGIRFKRIAFADPLKIAAARSLGVHENELRFGDELKNNLCINVYDERFIIYDHNEVAITGREYLQNFGVAAREVYGEGFWVDLAMREASRHKDVVITDVRFSNEAEAIRKMGGVVLYVYREENPVDGDHVSEQKLSEDLIDYYVDNTGTKKDLAENLKEIYNAIIEKHTAEFLRSRAATGIS